MILEGNLAEEMLSTYHRMTKGDLDVHEALILNTFNVGDEKMKMVADKK